MKVIVMGKERRSGTAKKTGKPYDSSVVYYKHAKNGVDGMATASVWLDSVSYPLDKIIVNKDYDLDFDSRGFVCGFDPV